MIPFQYRGTISAPRLTRSFFRLSLLLIAGTSLFGSCVPLGLGRNIKSTIAPGQAACFVVTLNRGESTQITVSQPVDIQIRLRNREMSVLADSFEFGSETITIVTAGENRVELQSATDSLRRPIILLMSRTLLPLQKAVTLRNTENLATNAKHSKNPADIIDCLRLWQKLGDHLAIGRTWLELGDAILSTGDLSSAREAYESALKLCRADSDLRCMAEAANNSGFVAQQQGEFDASIARLNEAVQGWRSLGDPLSEGQTLSNLGLLFRQTGDYQHAISLYDHAARSLPNDAVTANARVWNNLGFCYQSLAEYDLAQSYFERALKAESLQADGARDAIKARLNLGRTFMLEGRLSRARTHLERALAEANRLDDRPDIATALNYLGQAFLSENLVAEAQDSLQRALKLHKILGNNRLIASDLYYLGMAAYSEDQLNPARQFLLEALELHRASSLRDLSSDTLFSLATLERKAGNMSAAADYIEQALRLLESIRTEVPGAALRASFYAQKRKFFDFLVDMASAPTNQHAAEDGLLAAERGYGRALLDVLAEGSVLSYLPQDLLQRRKTIQRQIDLLSVRLTAAASDQDTGLRRQVDSLVAEDERIEADIRQEITGQNLGRPLQSIQQLQHDLLPADAALLEFHLGPDQSYLWLVDSTQVQVFCLPARPVIEAQAKRAVDLFGKILDRRRFPEKQAAFQRDMRELSKTLLGPLSAIALPHRLVIVPDGILGRVPFAALTLPSAPRGIGLTHDLIQVPAAAFLNAGKAPRPLSSFPKALLALADPVFSPHDPRVTNIATHSASSASPIADLPRLPYSAELDVAMAQLPGSERTILRGFDATSANLRNRNLNEYGIIHFSTHAFIDDRIPELSRIALSMVDPAGKPINGLLRPYHLAELQLNGSTVVLSACDTALGKEVIGEGLDGLTASLFHAGASQLLLTLTEVDAEGSSEFLKKVYSNLFSPRTISMEHALTLARNSLARSERWSDPYYWASFSLYGRPMR